MKRKNSKHEKESKVKPETKNKQSEDVVSGDDDNKNSKDDITEELTEGAQSKKENKEPVEAEETDFETKYEELNDKYLRLYSEFDNYRKRTLKEKLDLSKTASEEIIVELLSVIDDFERAIKSSESVKDCEPVKEGMSLIYNKFTALLTKKGLKAVESVGQEFDTDFHEAITYIPAPTEDLKGKIVDEIQKGYMLQDKVIRYAKVVIGQ